MSQSIKKESSIYGVHACKKVFEYRHQDIIRCAIAGDRVFEFGNELKLLSAHKKAYRIVEGEELEKITKSVHHEGICLLCKTRLIKSPEQVLLRGAVDEGDIVLVLDDVGNPHNMGAIIRSAVHFGVRAFLVSDSSPVHAASIAWSSRGASEMIDFATFSSIDSLIAVAKSFGYSIVVSDAEEGVELATLSSIPQKFLLAVGSESHGVSHRLFNASHLKVRSIGTGRVESLNVSVATGVLLSKFWELARFRQP